MPSVTCNKSGNQSKTLTLVDLNKARSDSLKSLSL